MSFRRLSTFAFTCAAAAFALACERPVQFDPSEWNREDLGAHLREGFLFGTATAAHQIEGGNVNDWRAWEDGSFPDGRPHIHDRTTSEVAAASWGRFETADLPLMKQLGANAYRFSVEWSRLEPRKGEWNSEAAQVYKSFARALRANGIEPAVTLHHFTLPQWVAEKGGFHNRETLEDFARFVGNVAVLLGDEVDFWCTVNEPNVYVVQGYIDGVWPPGEQSSKMAAEVLAHLLEAHALAAQQLRAFDQSDANGDGRNTFIGLAHHVRVFQPATASTLDGTISALTDDFFNESVPRAVATGRIQLSVPGEIEIDRRVPLLEGSFDYLGINYYTRDHVRANPADESLSNQYVAEGRPTNDLGWDIYPEGLYRFLHRFSDYGWPIYITENGMADNAGDRRPEYLRMHLHAIERASMEGVDVRGYFHWSLMDNFEWAEGLEPRFGLFRVDFEDPERTRCPTPAAETFREIAANLGHGAEPLADCP